MIARAAVGCMPVLNGVLKGRNHFVEIRRQYATSLDYWPQCHRRCADEAPAERERINVVVEVGPPSGMPRIAGLPKSWSAILPSARATDIVTALVRQEHVSPSIKALRVPLQAAGARREQGQVRII
jgi:hypothetical protein